jgi:hypothetical protein
MEARQDGSYRYPTLVGHRISYEQSESTMAPKVHPIGKRFERLSTKLVISRPSATESTTASRVKIYFVMADQWHNFMCRYYWQEGETRGPFNELFEFRVLDANAEDDPSAPSDIKNEIIGVEGGGFVPKEFPSSVVAVDGFVATEGRSRANVGILGAGTDRFSVYFHDIDLDAPPSPTFKLLFRGNLPKNLATRDLSGWLNMVGGKRKFNLDDSWIPRF